MGGFSIYGGSADELVLTSGAKDYEGSPRLESNLWTSCISYVHRDSSLGGRASGCREESYTSIFPLMWLYRYIHSAPVYVPPLFMCLMIKLPSFSCFRNFLEIESDSELGKKKWNSIYDVSQRIGNRTYTVIDPISNFFQIAR